MLKTPNVNIDYRFIFYTYISMKLAKASSVNARLFYYNSTHEFSYKKQLNTASFISQLNYCQPLWICYNCKRNNQINCLH